MRYIHLNAYSKHEEEHLAVKINSKIDKICSKMAKLARKQGELDRQLVKEFAKVNDISEDEASDIMSSNDFLVDSSQYGLSEFAKEITKEEYLQLKKQIGEGMIKTELIPNIHCFCYNFLNIEVRNLPNTKLKRVCIWVHSAFSKQRHTLWKLYIDEDIIGIREYIENFIDDNVMLLKYQLSKTYY